MFYSYQIFLGVGILEWINHDGKMTMQDMHKDSTREVGQFSLPFYGASQLKGKSEAQVADIKLKELKNGRLAMIGKIKITNVMQLQSPLPWTKRKSRLRSCRLSSFQLIILHLPSPNLIFSIPHCTIFLSQLLEGSFTKLLSPDLRPSEPSLILTFGLCKEDSSAILLI